MDNVVKASEGGGATGPTVSLAEHALAPKEAVKGTALERMRTWCEILEHSTGAVLGQSAPTEKAEASAARAGDAGADTGDRYGGCSPARCGPRAALGPPARP